MRPKAYIFSMKQCFVIPYINRANQAPGACTGHSPWIISSHRLIMGAGLGGSVGWAVRLETRGFNPHQGRQHSFVEIDHKIFSTVILSQFSVLSVSGERMCTILVNCLED